MINPFVKFKGLEFFGTYENAHGRSISEASLRPATQYAADVLNRFPANRENFWVGFKYNTVTARLQGMSNNITIRREVGSAGWFLTRNILLKLEYVSQDYLDYPDTNILNSGKFYGAMIEASVAF